MKKLIARLVSWMVKSPYLDCTVCGTLARRDMFGWKCGQGHRG